ncbi:MAG: P-loop NTPase [Candidatus Eisenbacteria sp.]|nr:P-loop NTPase [Candidatus Eisenbacteria bacterium]
MEPLGHASAKTLALELPRQTWAVGGGKGGVGKSLVTVGLAYWLGRLKKRVILVDADLGGANLHTMLGIRIPEATLEDFLLRKVEDLEDVLLDTTLPNVRLLAGGSEIPSLANPNFNQKRRLLRALDRLSADYMLVDLGAGSTLTVLDFFLASPYKLVVMRPQPTSVQNAYGFIKAALFRRLSNILRPTELRRLLEGSHGQEDRPVPQSVEEVLEEVSLNAPEALKAVRQAVDSFNVQLVVNMARNPKEEGFGRVIAEVCHRYLEIDVNPLGSIPFDPSVDRWASRMDLGTFGQEGADGALRATYEVAYAMLSKFGQMNQAA